LRGGVGKLGLALFALLVLASCLFALPAYSRLNRILEVNDWVPNTEHKIGIEIKKAVGKGRVLTLAPLLPLEGGVGIYEQLATGPFSWRVAGQLSAGQRKDLIIASGDDLDSLLQGDPPGGILVGLEPGLEDALVRYAQAHGFKPMTLSNGATLWLPPR
jgi:hypothetical protein